MVLLVVITVDLETPQTPLRMGLLKNHLFDLKIDNQRLGYSVIVSSLSRFGLRGVFFVNVYEATLWGDQLIKDICREIVDEEQEVALHTHPEWAYDPVRIHMWQYSVEEQTKIIADGLKILQQWLPGYKIIAHRAGAYGANQDTLNALRLNRIFVDSSMFYGHPNCRFVCSKNQIAKKDMLLEIPITGFFRERRLSLAGIPLHHHRSFVKTDVDATSLKELRFFVEEAKKHNIRVMNLFLHSYSFIRFNADFSHFEPDYQDMEKFIRFLEYATADPAIRFVTMRELYEVYQENPSSLLDGSDYVPIYRYNTNLIDKMKRMFLSKKDEL